MTRKDSGFTGYENLSFWLYKFNRLSRSSIDRDQLLKLYSKIENQNRQIKTASEIYCTKRACSNWTSQCFVVVAGVTYLLLLVANSVNYATTASCFFFCFCLLRRVDARSDTFDEGGWSAMPIFFTSTWSLMVQADKFAETLWRMHSCLEGALDSSLNKFIVFRAERSFKNFVSS